MSFLVFCLRLPLKVNCCEFINLKANTSLSPLKFLSMKKQNYPDIYSFKT